MEYLEIKLEDLPTKGIYYEEGSYIKIRPFSDFEKSYLMQRSNNFIEQLDKIDFALNSLDTNIFEESICYTDAYYLYYLIYGLTYEYVNVVLGDNTFKCQIDPDYFVITNPDFNKIEDLYFDKYKLKFYHPTLHNVKRANLNIVLEFRDNPDLIDDKYLKKCCGLVPYMQKDFLSVSALDFVNEHLTSFNEEEIDEILNFVNDRENLIIGQRIEINNKEIIIKLQDLI